jgi:hypothetical protein
MSARFRIETISVALTPRGAQLNVYRRHLIGQVAVGPLVALKSYRSFEKYKPPHATKKATVEIIAPYCAVVI